MPGHAPRYGDAAHALLKRLGRLRARSSEERRLVEAMLQAAGGGIRLCGGRLPHEPGEPARSDSTIDASAALIMTSATSLVTPASAATASIKSAFVNVAVAVRSAEDASPAAR